jgi:hypothetical protein
MSISTRSSLERQKLGCPPHSKSTGFCPRTISFSSRRNLSIISTVLARIEQRIGGRWVDVDRFTPMNLKWSYVGTTTRAVILPGIPAIFCDFIHVGDPGVRVQVGENLASVPPGDVVLALDVEAVPLNQGNLLEPGTYRFHLILVADNYGADSHTRFERRTSHQVEMSTSGVG